MISTNEYGMLLAGDRQTYRLDESIGAGGEGTVYLVSERPDLVAKLYHEFDFLKEEKLDRLTELATKRLLRVAAWPLSPLRDAENRVVGFIMPRLKGWQPLHTVYNVRQRLQSHPDRTWQFMIRAARNLAVCVHHVHEAGLVVGDLNESNVFVDHNAMAKLIDVDSFQVKVGDRLHGCYVGRPELLAPELQGKSLMGVERTVEHDRFALAVLIFQMLAFGRHPFAGKQEDQAERPLEDSIREGHYAYSKLRPGPLSPPRLADIDYLPEDVQSLFESAFDPANVARPTGQQWFSVLRGLEGHLQVCPENDNHRFWTGCRQCPWCRVEDEGGISLFPAKLSPTELHVNADALWPDIQTVIDRFLALPESEWVNYKALSPTTLSKTERFFGRWQSTYLVSFAVCQLVFHGLRVFRNRESTAGLVFAVFFVVMASVLVVPTFVMDRLKRRLTKATDSQTAIESEYIENASHQVFNAEVQKLEQKRDFLKNFDEAFAQARQGLIHRKYARQLESFLKKYSTLAADIGQFGRDQISNLYDRGIKTAADITDENLKRQPAGYANVLKSLQYWRAALVVQFWETGSFHLSGIEEQKLHKHMHKQAQEAKKELREGVERLENLILDIQIKRCELAEKAAPYQEVIRELGPRVLAFEQLSEPKPQTEEEQKVPVR